MEKRKWLWKRKSSERSPGETESSGSISSHSERFSDEQLDTLKAASPTDDTHFPEVTSKTAERDEDVNESIKNLTERLSAALVNVSAKDDLVKQHAKVAEEAVAGWEKAENEVSALKKKLEAAVLQNSELEDRVSHLDGALKECVRQLRQAREEQEEKVQEAIARKTREWESAKSDLENQLLELKVEAETAKSQSPQIDLDLLQNLEYLEKDNASLKLELLTLSEELEVRTIERDLSTHTAETASKQHLESIKKVAKLEAECRTLKALACKSTSVNDHKTSTASLICVESGTDGQSDSGERLNAVDVDTCKVSYSELYKCEPSCSESWASALIAELDQFKNEKAINQNLPSSSIEIDLMDDFLEMERLAAMPEAESGIHHSETKAIAKQTIDAESSLRAELEVMIHRTTDLEEKLQKMEGEKVELEEKLEKILLERTEMEMTLTISQEKNEELQIQLREAELKLEELQQELYMANELKKQLESQLVVMEAEARTMVSKVNLIEEEVVREKALSAEITAKCKALEEELSKKVNSLEAEAEREKAPSAEISAKCKALEEELSETKQEVELQNSASSDNEPKIKQEDLAAAAGKLAECQKTIASLEKQLKSLATLEDFLIDTGNLTELSAVGSLIPRVSGEPWNLHSSELYSTSSSIASENSGSSINRNEGHSPPSSSSTSSAASNHVSSEKNRNGFAKFFSRSKNGIQLEI